mmetsp:Transcript_32547/g.75266  ORF Transcript_32547/g.75266 Transcript_32547/m.75266 type:complete len:83 (+) Transcript_32547:420-668(+)
MDQLLQRGRNARNGFDQGLQGVGFTTSKSWLARLVHALTWGGPVAFAKQSLKRQTGPAAWFTQRAAGLDFSAIILRWIDGHV